jgi:hypothetical protein
VRNGTLRAIVAEPRIMTAERRVRVDNFHVRPSIHAEDYGFTVDQMFAVTVLWDLSGSWRGWLSTINHRAIQFSPADLENEDFRRWLAALPGWAADRMTSALGSHGLHLVWRRPGS